MKTTSILFVIALHSFAFSLLAQKPLPVDSTGEIVFVGKRADRVCSKKKKMTGLIDWTSAAIQFPPMVFSTISAGQDTLVLKAVTEIPSLKGLHPISFKLELVAIKRGFAFRASKFYFEDINISLQQWLDKYGDSDNKRNQRNAELITMGIESHILLSMNLLNDTFKK